ncbi:MAG TPA: hypothetical protein VKB34_00305 [Povalibacter sp.]|nr:hypothetical protein [Povalibacter sp.]
MKHLRPTLVIIAIAVLSACATQPSQRPGASSTVQFGVVRSAQEITLDSNAGQGALIGGTLGLIAGGSSSTPRQVRNAIIGAGAGAAVTSAAQGNRRGMSYQVDMIDGSVVRIVTDQREIRTGDCVAIERVRETANIRRVAQSFCDRANTRAVQSVADHSSAEATACEAAKQELVRATTQEAVDLAARKVSLLCDS